MRSPAHARFALLAGACAVVAGACSFGPEEVTHRDRTKLIAVSVLDETGTALTSATFVDLDGERFSTDFAGVVRLDLSQPTAGVIYAPGKLPEPVAIGTDADVLTITMVDRMGPNGERISMHFGGDTMLGRRYQAPIRNDTPRVESSDEARELVSNIAPLMAAADLTTVNLETVVGTLPGEDAYPGKIFLVQSPPLVTDALEELGVDVAMLGNNHIYDWQERGIVNTQAALDRASIAHVGAGLDAETARRGIIVTIEGREVGIVSLSGLDGDRFNGFLPERGAKPPVDAAAVTAWQFESRVFGFGEPGEPGYIATASRVPREVWDEFSTLEPTLSEERAAELWAAITAPDMYPQLQDWVARRGHGGAGQYDRETLTAEIERLRSDGAETVVVQFHSGFQFTPAPSVGLRFASRAAIEAGADIVVSHHPHVLQGIEWYQGKLVVYSLGNFMFDQNFHSTYHSAFLRVIVDDTGLVEARFVPLMLDRYRPVPATGAVAARIVRSLAARSMVGSISDRVSGLDVTMVQLDALPIGFEPAGIALDRNSGVVSSSPSIERRVVEIGANEQRSVGACTLVSVDALPPGVEYGVDLFGWGEIDDGLADRERDHPLHLRVPDDPDAWSIVQGDGESTFNDALRLSTDAAESVQTRNISLVPRARNQYWIPDRSRPADVPPRYNLELDLRVDRSRAPILTIATYRVSDEDVTREPDSSKLHELDIPIPTSDSDDWHHISIPVPSALLQPVDGEPVDGIYFTIESPPAFRSDLDLDNIELIEWRSAAQTEVPLWSEVDYLQSSIATAVEVDAIDCSKR
jgi:poly-gamma-glutamate capsule biosynthesis protein CapA/YwtB (metallophosphatase superfamily)